MVACYHYIIALFLISPLNCHQENTTNAIDIRDEQYTITKYIVVILFSLFLLFAIINNVLMAIVCCNRDNPYSRAFILITSQIIICNLISFTPHMIVLLPGILLAKNNSHDYKIQWINRTFATINTFSFYAVLNFAFLWTFNRFLSIILPKYNAIFESTTLYFLLIFMWLAAFAISFVDSYYCTRSLQVSTLHWTLNCTKQPNNDGERFSNFRRIFVLFLSITMVFMYLAIFCNIRHRFTSVTNGTQKTLAADVRQGTNTLGTVKYERSMLIQATLTCGVFIIGIILVDALPKLSIKVFGEKAFIPANICINSYLILGRTVLPICLFATNKHVRKYLQLHLRIITVKRKRSTK